MKHTAAKKTLLLNKSFTFVKDDDDDDALRDLTPLWDVPETPDQTRMPQKVLARRVEHVVPSMWYLYRVVSPFSAVSVRVSYSPCTRECENGLAT